MTLASILGLGFLLGMGHAVDTDHLAAVATAARRSAALVVGALWQMEVSLS